MALGFQLQLAWMRMPRRRGHEFRALPQVPELDSRPGLHKTPAGSTAGLSNRTPEPPAQQWPRDGSLNADAELEWGQAVERRARVMTGRQLTIERSSSDVFVSPAPRHVSLSG